MKIKENKMINIDYLEKASKSSDFLAQSFFLCD